MNGTAVGVVLLRALGLLPLPLSRLFGAVLGDVFYFVSAERRHVAQVNLALCFPDLDERARRRLARAHFRRFAQALIDRGWLWWGSASRIERLVQYAGLEHFEAALAKGPVLLLAPHFVGLDAGGTLISIRRRVVSTYSKQKNRDFDAVVLAARRRFNEPVLFSRQDGIRQAIRAMREGLPFYYLPDMDFGARDAIFVPFFEVPAATVSATARMTGMAGASLVPCVTRMTAGGYETRFYPTLPDFPGDDVEAATRRINAFIEDRVREMPSQYLWTHKRFKTRPPGEAGVYLR